MEITINGTLVYEIESKRQWINRFPGALPKLPKCEVFLWVDRDGNIATVGEDFSVAEDFEKFPIKIYWLQRIAHPKNLGYVQKIKDLF